MRRGLKYKRSAAAMRIPPTIRRFPDEEGTEIMAIRVRPGTYYLPIRRFPDEEGTEITRNAARPTGTGRDQKIPR